MLISVVTSKSCMSDSEEVNEQKPRDWRFICIVPSAVVLNEAFPDGQQEVAVFSPVTVPGKHLQKAAFRYFQRGKGGI